MNELFKEVRIWRRPSDILAIRYSCLEEVISGKYAVQSADFFRVPLEKSQFQQFEQQFVELFIEISPLERCDWFNSLEDAIASHDKDFSR